MGITSTPVIDPVAAPNHLRMSGRRGRNSLRPRMRTLPSSRYAVTVTALTPSGGRSKPHTVVIVVRAEPRPDGRSRA